MRYLVTGSAGFIGSHLSEALRADGHDVVGLDCFTDYYDVALKEENARGQEIRRVDLARDAIDLDGIDGIFHLAGQPGVRSFGDVFELYLERNVLFGTQPIEEPDEPEALRFVYEQIKAERRIVFSTDYPHFDYDEPARALSPLPREMRTRVLGETALELYRMPAERWEPES